jgi:hypothetical protein
MDAKEYRWELPSLTTRKRNQLTVFGLGTTGIQVVGHLYKQPIKDTRFVVCHADQTQLYASPVPDKLWYAVDLDGVETEQHLSDDLKAMLQTSELTLIISDLANPVDCHLATEAVRIARELGEFTIAVLGTGFGENQAMQSIQQLVTSTLVCKLEGIAPQQRVYHLAAAVFRLIEFCDDFIDQDFDVLRKIIASPGRIAIMTGRGIGDNRVSDAFNQVVAQSKDQQFIRSLTKRLMLKMSASRGKKPVIVREHTGLMEHIMNFINTEPTDVRMGFITDESLAGWLVINLLLWMPLGNGVHNPEFIEKRLEMN